MKLRAIWFRDVLMHASFLCFITAMVAVMVIGLLFGTVPATFLWVFAVTSSEGFEYLSSGSPHLLSTFQLVLKVNTVLVAYMMVVYPLTIVREPKAVVASEKILAVILGISLASLKWGEGSLWLSFLVPLVTLGLMLFWLRKADAILVRRGREIALQRTGG